MNKGCLKSGLTALLGGMTLMAWAADPVAVLQQPQGKVFVSQGKVMAPVQQSLPLYAGNRVIVASGGRAEIAYPDGCVVALPENSLLAVKGADQCRLGLAQVRATGGFQDTRIGQAGPIASNAATAEIRKIEGSGVVGQSKAAPGMRLFKGNKVTAGSDSQVMIRYSNGCEVTVEASQSLVIDLPPVDCVVAGADGATGTGTGTGAGGATGTVSTGGLIVGGAFGASVIGAILANDDDDDSTSPAN
jgi:hypothetical protein